MKYLGYLGWAVCVGLITYGSFWKRSVNDDLKWYENAWSACNVWAGAVQHEYKELATKYAQIRWQYEMARLGNETFDELDLSIYFGSFNDAQWLLEQAINRVNQTMEKYGGLGGHPSSIVIVREWDEEDLERMKWMYEQDYGRSNDSQD